MKMDSECVVNMISTPPPSPPPYQSEESAKLPQYLVSIAASLAVFCGGTVIGWSSPTLPQIQYDPSSANTTLPSSDSECLRITLEEASWVGALLPVGALIGCLPAGSLADAFGRKSTTLAMALPLTGYWVLTHLACSATMLYAARLLGGLGLGALCATVPMYISEIAEDSIRGALCSAFQVMVVFGILYAYILGALVPYSMLPLLCGIFNLIFVLSFFWAPETPAYLLKKGKRKEAEAALLTLRGNNYNIYKELHLMEKALSCGGSTDVSFLKAIRERANMKGFIICMGLMFFQQATGISIVIMFSNDIFLSAGSSMDPAIATIFVGLASVISAFLSAALIEKAGRKCLLQVSALVMALCLGVLGYYFYLKEHGSDVSSLGVVPPAAVLTYVFVSGVGFGPVPWIMNGELLSSEIKGVGSGLAVAINNLSAFTVTKLFITLQKLLNSSGTYWLLMWICVAALLFSIFVVIETKGKSAAQVQDELSGRSSSEKKKKGVPA